MPRGSTRRPPLLTPIMGCVLMAGFVPSLHAVTLTLDATDSGWYNQSGVNFSVNYIAGVCCGSGEHRDFFVFDLPGVTGPVLGATLKLFNPGYVSPDPTETYTLFSVNTPISILVAGGSGLTQIFDDLGSGLTYGSRVVSHADDNTLVEIGLNASALTDINVALGRPFAIGGAITTLQGTAPFSDSAPEETIFINSGSSSPQLVLDVVVPEPTTLVLILAGLTTFRAARKLLSP